MVDAKKVACYVTSDNNYLIPAMIAIKSFQRYFPNIDYYILTNTKDIELSLLTVLQNNNIAFMHTTEYEKYDPDTLWPSIAFAMVIGPEIFYDHGYQYSIGIDADVLCKSPFNLDFFINQTKSFSGIVNQDTIFSNFRDKDLFLKTHNILAEEKIELVNPNTGFIIWNNQWAKEFGLKDKCFEIFSRSKQIIKSVDQGLLAGVILKYHLHYYHLDHIFNYRVDNKSDNKLSLVFNDIKILHFTGPKPWKGYRRFDKNRDTSLNNYFWKLRFYIYWYKFIYTNSLGSYFDGFTLKSSFSSLK